MLMSVITPSPQACAVLVYGVSVILFVHISARVFMLKPSQYRYPGVSPPPNWPERGPPSSSSVLLAIAASPYAGMLDIAEGMVTSFIIPRFQLNAVSRGGDHSQSCAVPVAAGNCITDWRHCVKLNKQSDGPVVVTGVADEAKIEFSEFGYIICVPAVWFSYNIIKFPFASVYMAPDPTELEVPLTMLRI